MALNVLHDHHRIIKEQTESENDTGQSNYIELDSHDPHQGYRCGVDYGDGCQDNQNLPEACEKEKDYQSRHDDGVPQGFEHILRTLDDGIFLGICNLKVQVRIVYPHFHQFLLDPGNGAEYVCVQSALD